MSARVKPHEGSKTDLTVGEGDIGGLAVSDAIGDRRPTVVATGADCDDVAEGVQATRPIPTAAAPLRAASRTRSESLKWADERPMELELQVEMRFFRIA